MQAAGFSSGASQRLGNKLQQDPHVTTTHSTLRCRSKARIPDTALSSRRTQPQCAELLKKTKPQQALIFPPRKATWKD